jgi:hypothetical protein
MFPALPGPGMGMIDERSTTRVSTDLVGVIA